jgi:hypothetical protein
MEVNRSLEIAGVLISVSPSRRERPPGEIAINKIADQNAADFLHVFAYPAFRQVGFQCPVVVWCWSNPLAERPNKQFVDRKSITISERQQNSLIPARSAQH